MSSFYIGYVLTHIPGGLLAERFGGKWTLSLGILIIAVCTIATPLTLQFGSYAWPSFLIIFHYWFYDFSNVLLLKGENIAMNLLIALRIIMGLAGGTTLPSLNVLIAAWIPENERSKLGGFVLGGTQVYNFLKLWSKNVFVNSSQYFTAGQCSIILHIWTIAVALAMASCILFLEFDCNHLVYSVCKCVHRWNLLWSKGKSSKNVLNFFFRLWYVTTIQLPIHSFRRKNEIIWTLKWDKLNGIKIYRLHHGNRCWQVFQF